MKFLIKFVVIFVILISVLGEKKCGKVLKDFDPCASVKSPQCGFGGEKTRPEDWPWLVALFDSSGELFFCAGSLISNRHVLTVAHTFQNKGSNETVRPEDLIAYVGKYNLNISNEFGSKNSSISNIFIHPDWSSEATSFDADIAVVVLGETVEFSIYIQPVCLPQQNSADVIGDGMVVGWGKSEHSGNAFDAHENIPREVKIPSINSSYCYPKFPQLALYSSHRMFCGGYENEGKGPCSGDSGGGFYSEILGNQSYVVLGIVSASLLERGGICDVNKFSLYTNVAWFVVWIEEVMRNTTEIA